MSVLDKQTEDLILKRFLKGENLKGITKYLNTRKRKPSSGYFVEDVDTFLSCIFVSEENSSHLDSLGFIDKIKSFYNQDFMFNEENIESFLFEISKIGLLQKNKRMEYGFAPSMHGLNEGIKLFEKEEINTIAWPMNEQFVEEILNISLHLDQPKNSVTKTFNSRSKSIPAADMAEIILLYVLKVPIMQIALIKSLEIEYMKTKLFDFLVSPESNSEDYLTSIEFFQSIGKIEPKLSNHEARKRVFRLKKKLSFLINTHDRISRTFLPNTEGISLGLKLFFVKGNKSDWFELAWPSKTSKRLRIEQICNLELQR
jgi:hypothetical protein